ncbi:serine hydrolase domain-containing protein [Streptomyces ureilyticus]|uniref:Beta-lactamase family protein n=1 Tax=Streptomyces ureilyticus TaxID=1775131 RepID=A0ABX0DUD4_9ACTN|nr:serine hydrolase domain-containing protein [Streptomyces ureilyticus]NGO42692.1 beta-lactamase family protein [Streptomyces ureilyticus]
MSELRQQVEPAEVGLDPSALRRLDEHFARLVDDGRLPGYLISVARHGCVAHLTSYGLRDREAGVPVGTDTIWRIQSMTKPIASVAALMLQEEGLLDLDDPIARCLPAFAEPRVYVDGSGPDLRTRPADGPVLIRHLLTHTAGLTFGFYHAHPVDAAYRAAGVERAEPPDADLAEACELFAGLPLQFEPGTQWNYSVATTVLGRVMEVVSGQPLDTFLAERVFRPLGMADAGFWVPEDRADRLAVLYAESDGGDGGDKDGGGKGSLVRSPEQPGRSRPRLLSANGGLVASAHDYHRFMEFLRRGGELDGARLLSPQTVATMLSNHLPADLRTFASPVHDFPGNAGVGFGFGVSVVIDPARTESPAGPGLYGWSGAAGTTFWVDPQRDLTVQFMSQVRPAAGPAWYADLRRLGHEVVAG